MQNKHADQGFTIVALSDEGESVVAKFVKEKKATYPIGIDGGGKTGRAFGVTGLPHAYLLDVDGRVVWEGHPGGGDYEKQLEQELPYARTFVPKQPLPKGLEKAAEKLKSGEFAEAIKLLNAAGQTPEASDALTALTAKAKALTERAKKLHEEQGRTYEGSLILADVATRFAGVDGAEQAKALLDQWKADKAIAESMTWSETFLAAEQAEAKGNAGPARSKYLAVSKATGSKLATLAAERARALGK